MKQSPLPSCFSRDSVTSTADRPPFPRVAKGIIFDIDGTLCNSWKLGFDATAKILQENSIPPITEGLYHECTKYATPERLARHAGLNPGDPEFVTVGNDLARQFDDLYVGLVTTETAGYFPGIDRLLRSIPSDMMLGALTNACVDYAVAVLRTNSETDGTFHRFRSIRGADNVPAPKPAPDGLYEVCKDLGLSPKDCIYVGDSPSDAVAAEAAGMSSIGVLWGSHKEDSLKKAPFSAFCSSVDELESLLTRIKMTEE